MRVAFLGGASGVGASCVLVEAGSKWVLVDAGVRTSGADRLPDLAQLDGKDLAAVIVTHAHSDHIGALPLVHAQFPAVPIYCSMATLRLISVMLADATRVMAKRASEEMEVPLYDSMLVGRTLQMLRPVPQKGDLDLPEAPGTKVHTSPAGHIAGAMSVGLETPGGRVLVSGDLSLARQRTIERAEIPSFKRPDLLVLESTYGARSHPNRAAEERRLAEGVAEAVERGRVLIPAFALGRAQEIALILRSAQQQGTIPDFPIWIDGLCRSVCSAYISFPDALSKPLAGHILRGGTPFTGANIRAVPKSEDRGRILNSGNHCVISSSGMLTGGPIAFYASFLASDPDATIMITGYQDDESPGAALLALAESGGEGILEVGDKQMPVKCRVEKYGLSAHADGAELAGWAQAVGAKRIALVHGDPASRAALSERLRGKAETLFPSDGDELPLQRLKGDIRSRRARQRLAGGESGQPFELQNLYNKLTDGSGVQTFTASEMAQAWYGEGVTPQDIGYCAHELERGGKWFEPVADAPGTYRLKARRETIANTGVGSRTPTLRLPDLRGGGKGKKQARKTHARKGVEQQAISESVETFLGGCEGLYKRGIDPVTGKVTLYFEFPDRARQQYESMIDALRESTGLEIEVYPEVHQGALTRAALEALPSGVVFTSSPSIRFDRHTVGVTFEGEASAEELGRAAEQFESRTGWRLEDRRRSAAGGQTVRAGTLSYTAFSASGGEALPVKQDEASGIARLMLEGSGLYKVSADVSSQKLTLRFYFPEVAVRSYARQIEQIAHDTGWKVEVHPETHQGALGRAADEVLPQGARRVGAPSLHLSERLVELRASGVEDANGEVEAGCERFREITGWRLDIKGVRGWRSPR